MSQKSLVKCLIAILVLAVSATVAQAVTIETVPVGNLGNANDTTGYGSVDYAYNIGKYEVTAGQYCEFLNAVADDSPIPFKCFELYNPLMDTCPGGCQITQHENNGNYIFDFSGGTVEVPGSTASDWENRPVNFVSWLDAVLFTNWLHNGQQTGEGAIMSILAGAYTQNSSFTYIRTENWKWAIPTDDEWYKAAYHANDGVTDNYYPYPTSSYESPGNDVTDPDSGNNATIECLIGDPEWPESTVAIGSPYYRTEVGAHENSASPYGTFDQGGNVWELNESLWFTEHVMRGGSSWSYYNPDEDWDDDGYGDTNGIRMDDDLISSYRSSWSYEGPDIGFRVVSNVPEPGSITLLLCGLLSLICWRRGRK